VGPLVSPPLYKCHPSSWTGRESHLVPSSLSTGALAPSSVVNNCKPQGVTERSSIPPPPTDFNSSLADRPIVCLDTWPMGWGRRHVEWRLPFGAFPLRRMSGFGCSSMCWGFRALCASGNWVWALLQIAHIASHGDQHWLPKGRGWERGCGSHEFHTSCPPAAIHLRPYPLLR